MNRRVDELLDLARGEVGMLKVRLRPVEPLKLLYEVANYMEPAAHNSGQIIHLQLPEKLPVIIADDDRIRQILLNLIGNSIKYSAPGGKINIRTREEPGELIIEIEDTGRGMTVEEQEKLFQPYYRIEGREHLSGLGLGLALSKNWLNSKTGEYGLKAKKVQEALLLSPCLKK
jgi:signal transduction histidine kinase